MRGEPSVRFGRIVVLVILATIAMSTAVVLAAHGESESFCQTGSLLFEDGSGWNGGEDAVNNSAFTLYDAEHNRLPPEAYAGTGSNPPPPIRRDVTRPVAVIALVLAVAGIVVTLVAIFHPADVESEVGVKETSRDDS